jgi:hypothetical protein
MSQNAKHALTYKNPSFCPHVVILILKGDYFSKHNYSFRLCTGDAVFIVRLELNFKTLLNTNFNLQGVTIPNTNHYFSTSFFLYISAVLSVHGRTSTLGVEGGTDGWGE